MPMTRELALVTGASSGIGREIARELAARNFNLLITARRRERLERLQAEIQLRHGVDVHVFENDLADEAGPARLYEHARSLGDVALLVNNAGFGRYGPLVDQELCDIEAIVRVNALAVLNLSRRFAADMAAAGRGRILNVASFIALQPGAGLCVYSATKAFVLAMSQTLGYELRGAGVTVTALCPGFTVTEFNEAAGWRRTRMMKLLSLDARQVAHAGVRGMMRGKAVVIPGWFYKLLDLANRLLPRSLTTAMSAEVVKTHDVGRAGS